MGGPAVLPQQRNFRENDPDQRGENNRAHDPQPRGRVHQLVVDPCAQVTFLVPRWGDCTIRKGA